MSEAAAVLICAPECSKSCIQCGFGLPVKVVGDVAEGGGMTMLRLPGSSPSLTANASVYCIAAKKSAFDILDGNVAS